MLFRSIRLSAGVRKERRIDHLVAVFVGRYRRQADGRSSRGKDGQCHNQPTAARQQENGRHAGDAETPADESKTLEEIGRRLGLTRERVRQIETEALKRLARLREMESVASLL